MHCYKKNSTLIIIILMLYVRYLSNVSFYKGMNNMLYSPLPLYSTFINAHNKNKIFINIWFAIRRLNKYILYAEGLSKGMQATQSVLWNEMYKWKDNMKYPGYEPELIYA